MCYSVNVAFVRDKLICGYVIVSIKKYMLLMFEDIPQVLHDGVVVCECDRYVLLRNSGCKCLP